MLEKIKNLKISDLDRETLNTWIETEITTLVNDFGQNIDNDMLLHICKRLRDKLNTSYKSWYVGTIHAIFQTGLSGGYGTVHKITVKSLFQFLKAAQSQMINQRATSAEINAETEKKNFKPEVTKTTEFITWASVNMICLANIQPDWNPVKEKKVAPKIVALADEFQQAKVNNTLNIFAMKLKNKNLENL